MKLEPVAWLDEFGNTFPLAAYNGGKAWRDSHKHNWKPLCAIPEGYVVVPVELIKEARRIIARAYADGNSASIRHYNCMTALDRLVDWKDGEECILPDEPR